MAYALEVNPNMTAVAYDSQDKYGRPIRKMAIRHTAILGGRFRDFEGLKDPQHGIPSLTISVLPDLFSVFSDEGKTISFWTPPGEDIDEEENEQPGLVTLKFNYGWDDDCEVYVKCGEDDEPTFYSRDMLKDISKSRFSDASFVVKVVHGERNKKAYTTLYILQALFTIRQLPVNSYEQDMLNEFGIR